MRFSSTHIVASPRQMAGSRREARATLTRHPTRTRRTLRLVTVLLTAGAALLMSGCDSFELCHHRAHGTAPSQDILIGFLCIGYHNPNTVHPDFTMMSGAPPQGVTSVQSGDLVLFSAGRSQTIPTKDGIDNITSFQWDFEGDGHFVSASTTPEGGPVFDVSH